MEREIRAAAIGVDNVISAWETMNDGHPYFAVYYNRSNKYFQYNRDDLDGAKSFLRNNLQVLEDNGDNSQYYLNIYAEQKVNYPNSGMICSFPFRLNEYSAPASVSGYGGNNPDVIKALSEAHAKQLEMTKTIAELQAANQPLDWFDKISGLLDSPGAANAIVPLLQPVIVGIMGAIGKISGIKIPETPQLPPMGIAGPREDNADRDALLDQALDRLEAHGDLLEMLTLLADFADKNPQMFKIYFDGLKQSL